MLIERSRACRRRGDLSPPVNSHTQRFAPSAPWDGAATQLFLSENSLDRAKLTEPRISIIFYVSSSELSGHRLRLEGIERERGEALWVGRDGRSTPLKRAEVSFDAIRE